MDGKVISMRPFTSVDYCKKKQGGGMKISLPPTAKSTNDADVDACACDSGIQEC
jgi:hypothetical protein